ncbi:uncharacterized protein LOC100900882 [Galendromus occidentalis]|uniref:Uncharacterized protein LOC100900882 n=1 Tax=Galendromus occidentalis TaxID=34638 RepID=A0AAJ6QTR4_9ACAR|nr:uncharacterized protein LOC100900882 [Galendromus occidentalis]
MLAVIDNQYGSETYFLTFPNSPRPSTDIIPASSTEKLADESGRGVPRDSENKEEILESIETPTEAESGSPELIATGDRPQGPNSDAGSDIREKPVNLPPIFEICEIPVEVGCTEHACGERLQSSPTRILSVSHQQPSRKAPEQAGVPRQRANRYTSERAVRGSSRGRNCIYRVSASGSLEEMRHRSRGDVSPTSRRKDRDEVWGSCGEDIHADVMYLGRSDEFADPSTKRTYRIRPRHKTLESRDLGEASSSAGCLLKVFKILGLFLLAIVISAVWVLIEDYLL